MESEPKPDEFRDANLFVIGATIVALIVTIYAFWPGAGHSRSLAGLGWMLALIEWVRFLHGRRIAKSK